MSINILNSNVRIEKTVAQINCIAILIFSELKRLLHRLTALRFDVIKQYAEFFICFLKYGKFIETCDIITDNASNTIETIHFCFIKCNFVLV